MDGQMLYRVTEEELRKHLGDRADQHKARSLRYSAEAEKLEEELAKDLDRAETVSDRLAIKATSNYSGNVSRRDELRQKVQLHARQATFFLFALAHLPEPSTLPTVLGAGVVSAGGSVADGPAFYLLSKGTLLELELVTEGRW